MSVSVSRGAFRPRRKMKLCAYNSMHLAPDASAVPTDCEIAKRHFPPRLPETVNRVETHATHRKQTTAHTSTRDVPAHDFFRQSFADHSATRNPCRAKDRGVQVSMLRGGGECGARRWLRSRGLRPDAALGYKRAAIVFIRELRRGCVARRGGGRTARNAIARRHVPVSLECPRRGDGASIFRIRWGGIA
jgi:hypothetical protein